MFSYEICFMKRLNYISFALFEMLEEVQENENIQTKNRGSVFHMKTKTEIMCEFSITYIFWDLLDICLIFHVIFVHKLMKESILWY